MSLFLNTDLNTNTNNPLPGNLIHTYSKKCYTNKEEAEKVIMNKVLLPGEVAFIYYYDKLSPYGQNALIAVGPLTNGAGNILFKNALELNEIIDLLKNSINSINASIGYLRDDLYMDLEKVLGEVLDGMQTLNDNLTNPLSDYLTRVENVEANQNTYQTNLTISVNKSINDITNDCDKKHL